MNDLIKEIKGGVCAPVGYEATGAISGVKSAKGPSKGRDLAILRSIVPAACAGVFTTNVVKSAPVPLDQKRLANGRAQAIVVNSGNANALTGKQGMKDALAATGLAAQLLGLKPDDVLICSTGIVGRMMPMAKILRGIRAAAKQLSPKGANDAALAIMTTDKRPKQDAVEMEIDGKPVRIGGMAKGAGMISPCLATMLVFITTDADLPAKTLQTCLKRAIRDSFNMITIDGDMSPSDTVLLMANGQAKVTPKGAGLRLFQTGLNLVASRLARMIVEDGEGATKVIAMTVAGAPSRDKAARVARAIANSSLVKCALHAGDPNWGRILTSAGAAGVQFDQDNVVLHLGKVLVFSKGGPTKYSAARAHKELSGKEVEIRLNLNSGDACATILTCDLSEEYVSFNAEYHT
jgi:glutamate N-acetyltransferase/amino-acid N-acetyltransferase